MAASKRTRSEKTVTIDPFAAFFPVGEAISTLLHPFAEVVLHDLGTGRIVRIWNSFSQRQAGDLSHLKGAQDIFPENQQILGPYDKALISLGRTKSITAGIRSNDDSLIGFLCINMDVTVLDKAMAVVNAFTSSELKRPEPIYRNDLKQHITYLVRDYSLKVNKPITKLSRHERMELVALVDQDGLFSARNSVMLLAEAMHISRASIYNMLNEHKASQKSDAKTEEQARPIRRKTAA